MQTLLTRKRSPLLAWLGVTILALLLGGCGGGGGGKGSSNSPSNDTAVTANLAGVVATGAPLIGAKVTVIDATAAACGTATSSLADGSYSLTLTCSSPRLPLFIQAVGVDMSGKPVVIHSVARSLNTGDGTRTIANINPLTNTVLALLMGGDPASRFKTASASDSYWARLGDRTVLTVASAFVKTAIATNMTDARLTNVALVDFFSDASFNANKTGLDAVIEGLNIAFSKDDSGNELLQISNRLVLPCNPSSLCNTNTNTNKGSPEVEVNLSTAKANLALSTPVISSAATVLTRTARTATTSTTAIIPNLSGLETVRAIINQALTRSALASEVATLEVATGKPVFSSTYSNFDGSNALAVAGTLSAYGALGYQLSSFQITGCLDYPIPTSGCSKIGVSALVRDIHGAVQGVFENAMAYSNATGWGFVGNGRVTPWRVYPVTWKVFGADGVAVTSTSSSPNPAQGVQVIIKALDFMYADLSMPSGHSAHFYPCSNTAMDPLCLGSTETGDLVLDQILPTYVTSWIGASDTRTGARYQIATTAFSGNETNTNVLTADLPSTSVATAYPLPDGLSSASTISEANVLAGPNISWDTWAAANPGLRMVELRTVITRPSAPPVKQVVAIAPLSPHQAIIPAMTDPGDGVEFSLWLVAEDTQGRRYISKIIAGS